MPRRSTPLRRRLFALVAVALLPIALLSAVGILLLVRQQRIEIRRASIDTTRAMVNSVDAELTHARIALETLATSRHIDDDDLAAFYEDAKRVAAEHPQWITIRLWDVEGRQRLNLLVPYGAVLPNGPPAGALEVMRTGRSHVSNLRNDPLAAIPAVTVRVPVSRDGKIKYVLAAALRPDVVSSVIDRQQVPSAGVVSILDADNKVVARSRNGQMFVGKPPSSSLLALIADDREGWGPSVTLEGNEVYAAFSRSQLTNWTVAVGVPRESIDAAVRHSYSALGVGLVLSIVLGLLAAILVARKITGPIERLRDAAQVVEQGDVPAADSMSIREIHAVGEALVTAAEARKRAEATREQLLASEREARAAAEAANRAKDEFLAMLGHELRNPLAAISSASQLFTRDVQGTQRKRAEDVIRRQTEHLSGLVDDLLDVSRVMTGKIALDRAPLELGAAIDQAITTVRTAGKLDRHHLHVEKEPVWVDADPLRVEQVLTNLVSNAVKYTPDGGTIRVRVAREGNEAVLRVSDTGMGITPELLPRIFDLFAQGEQRLERAKGGLGIGLTLVRQLVELHGGSIEAESEGPDRGSTFTVRLPAIEAPAKHTTSATRPPHAMARHILIVEDNPDAREMLKELLEASGHTVDVADDGPAGLEQALAKRPQIALIDVGLPGLDGYEVARRIRASSGSEMMLVALTGYGSPDDKRRTREAGFDHHMVKPVKLDALSRLLTTAPP